MAADVDWHAAGKDGWEQPASLERVEVYQATGMLLNAFATDAADAVALLRAHAITAGLTASDVAYQVLERRLLPVDGEMRPNDGQAQA